MQFFVVKVKFLQHIEIENTFLSCADKRNKC